MLRTSLLDGSELPRLGNVRVVVGVACACLLGVLGASYICMGDNSRPWRSRMTPLEVSVDVALTGPPTSQRNGTVTKLDPVEAGNVTYSGGYLARPLKHLPGKRPPHDPLVRPETHVFGDLYSGVEYMANRVVTDMITNSETKAWWMPLTNPDIVYRIFQPKHATMHATEPTDVSIFERVSLLMGIYNEGKVMRKPNERAAACHGLGAVAVFAEPESDPPALSDAFTETWMGAIEYASLPAMDIQCQKNYTVKTHHGVPTVAVATYGCGTWRSRYSR